MAGPPSPGERDVHTVDVHEAIKDTARANIDNYEPVVEVKRQMTPVYGSHKKQLQNRKKEEAKGGKTAKRGSPSPEAKAGGSRRAPKGTCNFETFGVEPIGKDSWRLDSPRSLKVT